jgi:UTP--glucose-1-phosphate uridylyltransferase
MSNKIELIAPVKKAVIPAAGLGTRLGSLSAITPKELLPLVDKPSLQWVLDEASESGITDVCLIISPSKNDLIQKFLVSYATNLNVHLIMQRRPGGLGHAILAAERWVGNDPFVVMLPDDFMLGENSVSKMMLSHKKTGLSTLALNPTPQVDLVDYDVAAVKPRADGSLHVLEVVEKPKLGAAPSNLSLFGRFLLTSDIWEPLHAEALNASGEIQLTKALQSLTQEARVVATEVSGERHNFRNQNGWLAANIAFSKWTKDGSSVIAIDNHQNFRKLLAGSMLLTESNVEADQFVENAIAQKKIIENETIVKQAKVKKVPLITTQMWDTAFMDLVDLELISLTPQESPDQTLRQQWRRYQDASNSVSPFVILYQDDEGFALVDGIERINEMQKLGMSQIPAWVVRSQNLQNNLSRL